MKQETIMRLKESACTELDKYAEKGLKSETDVRIAKDLVSMCHKLCMMEGMDDYSGDGRWNAEGMYSRALMHNGTSWDDGNYSRAYQGGGYSREGYNRGTSYGDEYSGRRGRSMTTGRYVSRAEGKEQMIENMENMLQESELTPEEARALKKAIATMQGQ